MPRRQRIKRSHSHQGFSLGHHTIYATSSTHFPQAYSVFGKEIVIPLKKIFKQPNKISYVGSIDQFIEQFQKQNIKISEIKMVGLSFGGRLVKKSSIVCNTICAVASLGLCCLNFVSNMNCYRQMWYPKYVFDDYDKLLALIQRFKCVETLVINFQDNSLTKQIADSIDQALYASNIHSIVLRNLTYFIELPGLEDFFAKIRSKPQTNFKFIWQKFKIITDEDFQSEQQRLLST